MNFTDFSLDSGLQEGLAEAGYITCMPVQEQVLKNGLEGADLYVQSQTGTGKTAAYLVTILQRLVSDPSLRGKKALIMVPTRELAVQVEEEARILGSSMTLKSASFYGGVGYGNQQDLLKRGVDVIIGTPGRVIDLQQQGTMDLSQVAFLVIDEADRMFDMGFYPDLRTLIKVLPKAEERQTMLFSATLNNWVKNLAWEYTIDAKEITIEAENVTVDEIDQTLYHVSSDEKMRLLLGIISREQPESLIIFCNTKRMSEVVAKRLRINGYESDFIIGDLPQSKRLQVIDSFKSGSLRCLVATDVAARGIDVDSLAMVINYDLPNEAENYVHRIGRTARAGKTGKAVSFCSEQDVYNLPAIEKYCEGKIPSAIATEDLMVEDKSRGVYIRTDRYDSDYDDGDGDRGVRGRGGRSGSRDGRRDGGRRDDRRGPSGSRSRVADGRPREDGERRDARRDGPRRSDPRRDGGRGGRPRDEASIERDLAKLSFEERMAYYKNKYGSDEAAQNAERQRAGVEAANRPSGQPEGRRTEGNRPNGGRSDGRRPEGRRPEGDRPRGGRPDGERAAASGPGETITRSGTKVRDAARGGNAKERRPESGRGAGSDARAEGRRDRGPAGARDGGKQGDRRPRDQRDQGNRRDQGAGKGRPTDRRGPGPQGRPANKPPRAAEGNRQPSQGAQKPAGILGGILKKIFGKK